MQALFPDCAKASELIYQLFCDEWTIYGNAHRISWIPPQGNGTRYQRMIQRIDPSAPKVEDEIHRVRSENQNKRIVSYRPALDAGWQTCSTHPFLAQKKLM